MDESSPFMKQLVSSDRQIRDKALQSLRTYLTSGAHFTPLDLLKLHKALFFAMWHQDRPIPQQKLATSLGDLALALNDDKLMVPYMRAFWATMAREWTNIDALRMDKFLRLVRVFVEVGFEWCRRAGWEEVRVGRWVGVLRRWPLSLAQEQEDGGGEEGEDGFGGGKMVGDGLRYHVLDVYVDELEKVDGVTFAAPVDLLFEPVRRLAKEGNSKALRDRAKECAEDERLQAWTGKTSTSSELRSDGRSAEVDDDYGDEEFTGLDGD